MSAIQTGIIQFFDPSSGKPVAFGSVATFQAGDNIPLATFSDLAQTTQNGNPVPLDGSGCASFFGSGAYKFIIYDAAGNEIRTIDNIGLIQTSSSVPDSETPEIYTGDTQDQFNGDDGIMLYDENNAVIGRAILSTAVMSGALGAGGVIGEYDSVVDAFSTGGSEVPAGALIIGSPQPEFDADSNRLYQLTAAGSSSVNPSADTDVSQSGKGENYNDLMRLAATEEIRTKRLVGDWSSINEIISAGDLSYPIMCFGSDGRLYKTTGAPSAASILSTDPVNDTTNLVWVYVYDPTTTAQYPPGFRALTGIDYLSSSAIKCPIQYQKLKDTSGDFVDDGQPTEIFYKSVSAIWAYGAGTSGSPIGGSPTGSLTGSDGWYDTYMVKTESGVIDYIHTNQDLNTCFAVMNLLTAEKLAGRTWAYGRRVGSFRISSAVIVEWYRSGSEYTLATTTDSSGFTSTGSKTVFCPPLQKCRVSLYVSAIAHNEDRGVMALVHVLGSDQAGTAYQSTSGSPDFSAYASVEHDVNYKSAGGAEFTRIADSNSQLNVYISGNTGPKFTFKLKSQGWIDQLED